VYSGPIAGSAYEALRTGARAVRRVVLLGPTHRVYVRGLALPEVEAFETPLGTVHLDRDAIASIEDLPQVVTSAAAHAREHALEVQVPFLQRLFGDRFLLVPLAVGEATPEEVAEVLERLWGGDETRLVISSDLSHYLTYGEGRRVDAETARHIEALESVEPDEACGARPLNGLLALARRRGLTIALLDLRSSGDTAGRRDEVVGYGAFAVRERTHTGGAP
jgi:AmmeMemoRadiSam system protein B